MKKKTLDSLDNEIIRLLTEDGRMPIGDMATRLNVTAPTVRSRIKNLEESGMLKVTGLINTYQHQELITALIGLNIKDIVLSIGIRCKRRRDENSTILFDGYPNLITGATAQTVKYRYAIAGSLQWVDEGI